MTLVPLLRAFTFSIKAGGQCPPYEIIGFFGFDFRNKVVMQDMSLEADYCVDNVNYF
ncbi:MAG: hypothetical protein DSM106950_07015 [Stigonema ocellatum SAG 48.90 = DSM 106950]|nr:hypothetical protein [Stigonema ocellatum SAG 48.90 = DSM 106950]